MKIGIDVDGVLTPLDKYQKTKGKIFFGKDAVADYSKYDIEQIFNCTKEEREKFWVKYIWEYCLKSPISPNASKMIKKWKEEGHEINIITGRVHTTKNNLMGKLFRRMLEFWLEKNDIEFDRIVYCDEKTSAEDKLNVCKHLGIDVMLEDKVENIESIKNVCKVICFDAEYNLEHDFNNVPRVHNRNFAEADKEIEKIKNLESSFSQKKFEILDGIERAQLPPDEKKQYYIKARHHYMNLPYPDKKMKQLEKNYTIAVKIGMPFFKLIFRPVIVNKSFIPKGNGYIFVANHLGSLDQFPIIAAIGDRPIHFMAAKKLLNMKRGFLYKHTGCIFVDRNDPTSKKETTDFLIQTVLNDKNIFIFPEGTRNYTDQRMLEFKKGAVSIAQTTGQPIVPFAINKNYNPFKKNRLIVRAGKLFYVNPEDDVELKTEELQQVISSMMYENDELETKLLYENVKQKKKTHI